jgi:hypothetical protein
VSDKYQVDVTLEYKGTAPDRAKVGEDAKILGIKLRECILYGHRGIKVDLGYVEGSITFQLLEEPNPKRQKT